MSTKTTDTNNIQYQPGSLNTYNALQPNIQSTLQNFMQNPLTSSFFNQRVGMGNNQISKMGASGMQALMSNFKTSGMSGGTTNPFLQSMIARQGRTTSGMMSNNFMQQLMNANQLQLGATGMAQSYNPLMTGSTGTQTTSGTGTWLPQLLSSLGGAALGGLTGGLTGGGGGGGGFQPTDINPAPSLSSVGAFPSMSNMPNVMTGFNPLMMGGG